MSRIRGSLGKVSAYAYKIPCKYLYAEDVAEELGLTKVQVCGAISQMRSVYKENVQIVKPGYVYAYHPGSCDGSCDPSVEKIDAEVDLPTMVLDFFKANQDIDVWCTDIMRTLGGRTAKEVRAAVKTLRANGYASNIRTIQNDLWKFSLRDDSKVVPLGSPAPSVRFIGRLESGDVIIEVEGKAYRAIPLLEL